MRGIRSFSLILLWLSFAHQGILVGQGSKPASIISSVVQNEGLRLRPSSIDEIARLSPEARRIQVQDWNASSLPARYQQSWGLPVATETLAVIIGGVALVVVVRDTFRSVRRDVSRVIAFVSDPNARDPFWKRMGLRWRMIRGPQRLAAWKELRQAKRGSHERLSCGDRLKSFAAGLGLVAFAAGASTLWHTLSAQDMAQQMLQSAPSLSQNAQMQKAIVATDLSDALKVAMHLNANTASSSPSPSLPTPKRLIIIEPSMVSEPSREDGFGRHAYALVVESPPTLKSLREASLVQLTEMATAESRGVSPGPLGVLPSGSAEHRDSLWRVSAVIERLSEEQLRVITRWRTSWIMNPSGENSSELPNALRLPHFDTRAAATAFRELHRP